MLPGYVTPTLPVPQYCCNFSGFVHTGNSDFVKNLQDRCRIVFTDATQYHISIQKNDVSLIIEKESTHLDASKSGFMTSDTLMMVMRIIKF